MDRTSDFISDSISMNRRPSLAYLARRASVSSPYSAEEIYGALNARWTAHVGNLTVKECETLIRVAAEYGASRNVSFEDALTAVI